MHSCFPGVHMPISAGPQTLVSSFEQGQFSSIEPSQSLSFSSWHDSKEGTMLFMHSVKLDVLFMFLWQYCLPLVLQLFILHDFEEVSLRYPHESHSSMEPSQSLSLLSNISGFGCLLFWHDVHLLSLQDCFPTGDFAHSPIMLPH